MRYLINMAQVACTLFFLAFIVFCICLCSAIFSGCMPDLINPDVKIDQVDVQAPEEFSCKVAYTAGEAVFYVTCPGQDPVPIPIVPGPAGQDGVDGVNGTDGQDGTNGVDGEDGADGTDGTNAIVEVIDPCGPQAAFDEVVLRMNGLACREDLVCTDLFAVYGSGTKIHLTGLYPGTYTTTDGTGCSFKVDDDLNVTW